MITYLRATAFNFDKKIAAIVLVGWLEFERIILTFIPAHTHILSHIGTFNDAEECNISHALRQL